MVHRGARLLLGHYGGVWVMTEYNYTVQFIGNYWVISTRVQIELEETEGNLSDEAREKAEEEADSLFLDELGISPLNFAHSAIVTLNLEDEDIEL
jgi:hypothetical protein